MSKKCCQTFWLKDKNCIKSVEKTLLKKEVVGQTNLWSYLCFT